MAKIYLSPYIQSHKTATAVATAAIASITTDAPTNTVELLTAGADGGLLTCLTAMPRATVTASSLCLFSSLDGGVTKRLKKSKLMAAQTVSATAEIVDTVFEDYTKDTPLALAPNEKLYVGSQVALATGIVFSADYGEF